MISQKIEAPQLPEEAPSAPEDAPEETPKTEE